MGPAGKIRSDSQIGRHKLHKITAFSVSLKQISLYTYYSHKMEGEILLPGSHFPLLEISHYTYCAAKI